MANRFLVAGGDGNWNNNNNWSTTDGGASGASFPVSTDAAIFNSNSGNANMTVNVASAATSLVVSGTYAGTLTFNDVLDLTTTCTFISGMTIAGTAGTLRGTTSGGTWTSGGKTLTCALTLTGAAIWTLGDSWTVNGLVTLCASTLQTTINANTLNCAGGITIGGTASTCKGTTVLKMTGTGTLQSSQTTGTINNSITFAAGGGTITVSGGLRFSSASGGTVLYTSGTMVMTGSTITVVAAYTFNTNGMTWNNITANAGFGLASNLQTTNLTFDTAGTNTMTGAFNITTVTFTTTGGAQTLVLTGNITASGLWSETNATSFTWSGAFDISADSCTMSGTKTITLPRDVQITGLTTSSDANVINGAFNWKTGGLTTTGALTGTATMLFNGTGTWTGAAGALSMNTTINTAGTLTLSGTLLFAASGTPTLTWTAGTVSAGTSILSIASACTLATSGMTWANVTISAALTLTLNSLLSASGTLTLPNAAVTFAGAGDFSVGTLTTATISAARVYTFDTANNYTITSFLTVTGLVGGHVSFVGSAVAGTRANMILGGGASQSLLYVDATDIDSSAGQPIFSFGGSLVRTINWSNSVTAVGGLKAVGYAA